MARVWRWCPISWNEVIWCPCRCRLPNPTVTGSVATLLRYLSRALSAGLRRRRMTVEALTTAGLEHEQFAVFDEWLDSTDRFISARRMRVSFLTRNEVLPLLIQPIPEFDMTYPPGSLDAIIDATNCQPFLTQAVAFKLIQFLNEQHNAKRQRPTT